MAEMAKAGSVRWMIRVLGPIDLQTDGGVVVPTGRIARKLLGVLAISANHMVSTDRLAEIIWEDAPPASRDNTLQTYIFRLRDVLGHDRIISEDHSYALRVGIDELDALVFESLASRAAPTRTRPSDCIRLCKQGLALWRGVPFGEFSDTDPFRLEAIRLDELRLFVMELRLECELEIGNEELVVGTLEALVGDHPYRERVWYLLVTALSLCGRRVEALRACRRLREVLGEVGLEPTEEMRRLEDEVISENPNVRPRLRFVRNIGPSRDAASDEPPAPGGGDPRIGMLAL